MAFEKIIDIPRLNRFKTKILNLVYQKGDVYNKNEIDNKFSQLETNIDWKEAVATYNDIATTYPNPVDGWTVNVKDTDYTYRYNGTKWVAISANAIPKATQSVDGLITKEDKTKLDGIATGAEVNQNAFSKVTVGSTTVTADSKADTLTLVAGSNVTITPDATNDKITIAATDTWRSVTTSLTSTSTDVSLAASAGKSLQDQISTLNSNLGKKISNPYYDNPSIKQGIKFDNNADGSHFTFRPILDENILQVTKNDAEALFDIKSNGDVVTYKNFKVTNNTNAVEIFADNEGGNINLDNVPVNRALQQDVNAGVYRAYLYQINPWQYLNDITIHPDKVTTQKDFVNGNGISLNSLNEKFNNYQPAGNYVANPTGSSIGMTYENVADITVPYMVIDGNNLNLIRFAGCSGHSAIILETELDISTNPWKLKIIFRIDGANYTKTIPLS